MTSKVTSIIWRHFVFFYLRPSNLITTLTYILMSNFCPCFLCVEKYEKAPIKYPSKSFEM